jgi:hypothetical protein
MNGMSVVGSVLARRFCAANAQAATVVCSGTIDTLQFDATSTSGFFSIRVE